VGIAAAQAAAGSGSSPRQAKNISQTISQAHRRPVAGVFTSCGLYNYKLLISHIARRTPKMRHLFPAFCTRARMKASNSLVFQREAFAARQASGEEHREISMRKHR
jgi:hypothetical protein